MYQNKLFPKLQSAVNSAQTLGQLMTAVEACLAEMNDQDRANVDLSMLPTFGGNSPLQTLGAWSWDEGNVLAGTGPSDWQIISRSEFAR